MMLNGFEADAHVLPTAVKVLIGQRQRIRELVALVLIVDLVVLVFLRQGEESEIEHPRAIFGLLHRRQGDAVDYGIIHIHVKGHGLVATKVRHGAEIVCLEKNKPQ